MSIGLFPDQRNYFPEALPVRLRSAPGADFCLAEPAGRLTASPATVYRCDPIEGWAYVFYSVIHARGSLPTSELSGTEKEIKRGDLCDFCNRSKRHPRGRR